MITIKDKIQIMRNQVEIIQEMPEWERDLQANYINSFSSNQLAIVGKQLK